MNFYSIQILSEFLVKFSYYVIVGSLKLDFGNFFYITDIQKRF